jgi:hypothetical protein
MCTFPPANIFYSFINPELNLNIYTIQADNSLFTFVRSLEGAGSEFKRAKVRNLEAFKFLQKYAGEYSFDVVYPKGEKFALSELSRQVQGQLPEGTLSPTKPQLDSSLNNIFA